MKNSDKPKFLLIGGFASSLINFRGPLLLRLLRDFEVFAAAPFIDDNTRTQLEKIGVVCISNEFQRTGLNPIKDLIALKKFREQIKIIQPDYVLAYTIKPVVFGLKAANLSKAKRFALITGKGSGFDTNNFKSKLVSIVVKSLYKRALKDIDGVIFQNPDDRLFFIENRLTNSDVNSTVIEGTGIDLNYFQSTDGKKINNQLKFLFIARLIKEKGIPELIEASRQLKEKGYDFEVQLLGWIDPNPGGISQKEINEIHKSRIATYLGTTDDVRPYIEDADVFVLPSYYNEGLPRTIQEAMAMKKPIITTDHPGCRLTVENGENGFLIPVKNPQSLAESMEFFINSPQMISEMGERSYQMAKDKFDVVKINERLINFMLKNV